MKKLLSILLAVLMAATLGVANITAEGEGSESDNVETFEIPVTYTVVKETNSSDVVVDDAPVKEVKAEIDADSFKQEVIKEDSSVKTELEDFQIEALNNGASANIELKVSNTSASEEDKKQVTDTIKADDTLQLGTFLDIELLCTVTDNNVPVGDPKNITQTDKEVTISLKVPDNLINTDHSVKRTYYVLRLHDGSVDELGTNFNNISGILTFKTNKFSLYAIAYKDAKIESGAVYIPSKKPVVNTGNVFEPAKIDIVGRTGSTTFKVEGLNESEVLEIEYDSKIELKSDDNETVKAAVSFVNSVNSDSTNIMTVTANKPDNPGVYKGTLTVTVTCKEYEAKIGNVYYDTINSAISASTENQTVKLLKNIDEQVMVPAGKSVTLDLNSKKISVKGIAIINNGSLVLENGTVESDSKVVFVGTDSTTVVNSGTYKGADVIVGNTENAVIEIKSGIFSSNLNDKYTKDKFIVDNGDGTIRVYSLSTDSEGNYLINSAADLVLFEKIVNESGYGFSDKTVILMSDINLEGVEWKPVGQTGGYLSNTYFQGTFDGNGKTISNLNIPESVWESGSDEGKNYATGFFGFIDAAGAIIKDVTFENANVEGHHWVGVAAGYMTGLVNNVTVNNSIITSTYENDEADGDKSGGVVGYLNGGSITDCEVTGSIITAVRDCGSIVGHSNGTVTGNSAYDCTVYYSTNNEAQIGDEIAGKRAVGVSNNTAENVVVIKMADVSTDAELSAVLHDAASKNIIVNLKADVTYEVTPWVSGSGTMGGDGTESITINGNGHTLTFNQTNSDWNGIYINNEDAVLTITDAYITNTGYNGSSWNQHDINFLCKVLLNNVVSDKAIAVAKDSSLNNVDISDDRAADDYLLWIQAYGQTVDVIDCKLHNTKDTSGTTRGIAIKDEYISSPSLVTLNVFGTEFVTTKKAAVLVTNIAGAVINWGEGNNISGVAEDSTNAVWADNGTDYGSLENIAVNGASAIVEP